VAAYLDEARQQKAELISGNVGPNAQGYYIAPTLVINPTPGCAWPGRGFRPGGEPGARGRREEALRLANDSDFGLTASVWTRDLSQALSYTDRLQAGRCGSTAIR
jgi:phenylacetaldehyde dehydrogenase